MGGKGRNEERYECDYATCVKENERRKKTRIRCTH